MPDFRVLTPDLPGHGRSLNPRPTFKFADVARDMFGNLDDPGVSRRHELHRGVAVADPARTLIVPIFGEQAAPFVRTAAAFFTSAI